MQGVPKLSYLFFVDDSQMFYNEYYRFLRVPQVSNLIGIKHHFSLAATLQGRSRRRLDLDLVHKSLSSMKNTWGFPSLVDVDAWPRSRRKTIIEPLFDHPPWRHSRTHAWLVGGPSFSKMVLRGVCVCSVWHGLRGTSGALSLSLSLGGGR